MREFIRNHKITLNFVEIRAIMGRLQGKGNWKMKYFKITGKILAVILAVVLVLLAALHIGVTVMYSGFFGNADSAFRIPGLRTGFVPQGFHYLQDQDCYLMSGYMEDHSSARIYIRDANGKSRFVELLNADGSSYDEHAGGVTTDGTYVYLPGTLGVDVFLLTDVLQKEHATMVPGRYT
jgi:hypothetical protein